MNASRIIANSASRAARRLFTTKTAKSTGRLTQSVNRPFSAEAVVATSPCHETLVKDAIKKLMDQRDMVDEPKKSIQDTELERRFKQFQVSTSRNAF